jgi:predicted ester cyclase
MDKHRAIAERAFALMNTHSFDALAKLFDDSCVMQMPGVPAMRGGHAFGEMVKGWAAAFPDIKHEIVGYVEEGDRASWQVRVTGTHTGTLPTPSGPLAATGRRIKIDAVDMARFGSGRVLSWNIYFDQLSFLQQLGLAPG